MIKRKPVSIESEINQINAHIQNMEVDLEDGVVPEEYRELVEFSIKYCVGKVEAIIHEKTKKFKK